MIFLHHQVLTVTCSNSITPFNSRGNYKIVRRPYYSDVACNNLMEHVANLPFPFFHQGFKVPSRAGAPVPQPSARPSSPPEPGMVPPGCVCRGWVRESCEVVERGMLFYSVLLVRKSKYVNVFFMMKNLTVCLFCMVLFSKISVASRQMCMHMLAGVNYKTLSWGHPC